MRYWLIILVIAIGVKASAQLSIGGRYGYGGYGTYFETSSAQSSLTQFQVPYLQDNAGFVLVFNNVKNAGLQLEVNLANKGWKEVDDTIPGSFFTRSIKYLEVPIMSHFELTKTKLRPIIIIGPYFGWYLSEKLDSANWDKAFEMFKDYNHYYQPIKNFNVGIKLGAGLRYNFSKRWAVYGEARYDLSFAGNSDIFIDRPNGIRASRLTEFSVGFGVLYHIFPQAKITVKEGYKPKEELFESGD